MLALPVGPVVLGRSQLPHIIAAHHSLKHEPVLTQTTVALHQESQLHLKQLLALIVHKIEDHPVDGQQPVMHGIMQILVHPMVALVLPIGLLMHQMIHHARGIHALQEKYARQMVHVLQLVLRMMYVQT